MRMVQIMMHKEKEPRHYGKAKNPKTLWRKNHINLGSIELDEAVIEDMKRGIVEPEVIDKIHDLGIYNIMVDLQVKKKGKKYGGWETIFKDFEV